MSDFEHIWYFAYGTNMSRETLRRRGVRSEHSEAGMIEGFRLRFSHAGLIPVEPAFANLERDDAGLVHGVLHRLAADQLAALDEIEGAEYRHLDVLARGVTCGDVSARTYLDPHPVAGLKPSRRYLRSCCDGAKEFGLPAEYIEELEAHPSLHIAVISDVANLLVGVAERLRRAGLRPELHRMRRREAGAEAPERFDDQGRFKR